MLKSHRYYCPLIAFRSGKYELRECFRIGFRFRESVIRAGVHRETVLPGTGYPPVRSSPAAPSLVYALPGEHGSCVD